MNRIKSARRYSIAELVNAAYGEAQHITKNPKVAAVIASKLLESWLTHSDRPDLVGRLQASAV